MVVTIGLSWVLNFANAVLGVGLLTMPYCFQECGALLTIIMILLCGHITKITCSFLLRAGIYTRKSTYEQLALMVFGPTGKLICEVSMIGVTVGTLIAFQVVIGDLAPAILSSEFGFVNTWLLRAASMIACCGLVLPLCLMRNVASLAGFNALSMTFYLFYAASVVTLSLPSISEMEWWTDIYFWRPVEFFKCLPIILLSYNCQGQVFIFYAALPDPNIKIMSAIVDKAINLVSTFYVAVGLFGYLAFYKMGVGGNILENFTSGILTDGLKLGFLGSVIISFPLMCFPVRSSINSLLFADKKQGILHDVITNSSGYIAPDKFVLITLGLVSSTVTVGILIPKVEVVLSITGALAGSFICLVYPTALFLRVGGKDKQRKFAAAVLLVSLFFMVTCTSSSLSRLSAHEPAPVSSRDVKTDTPLKDESLTPELPMDKINTIDIKEQKEQDLEKESKKLGNEIKENISSKVPEIIEVKEIPNEVASKTEKLVPALDTVDKKHVENEGTGSKEVLPVKLKTIESVKAEDIKGNANDGGTPLNMNKVLNDTHVLSTKSKDSILTADKSDKVSIVKEPSEIQPMKGLSGETSELPLKLNESDQTKLTREILSKQ